MAITITTGASIGIDAPLPVQSASRLIKNHPAGMLFRFCKYRVENDCALVEAELEQKLSIGAPGFRGALGCLIDCVVQLASHDPLGDSGITELEVGYGEPWQGGPVRLDAQILSREDGLAIFSCSVSSLRDGAHLAQAQGTLCSAGRESGFNRVGVVSQLA
ncbi:hypothetical protein [Gilvimarinus algae]|uniref:Uncharacterized protein n=1 Tax=Gilvimarinus algae TaxID=3058037 RepID=A0ABT8TAV4_9GAMM|nr:hypothetical protein [Gilvimarinus sp. SDUM040014]MDO3381244.1 hypothetical protein [Gilvimarinus sp. SDUM040014]